MAWSINIQYDADQNDVGKISATWTDPTYGDFTVSDRIKSNAAGANAFVTAAIAARDAWQGKQSDAADGVIFVLNKFNTTDPQVI